MNTAQTTNIQSLYSVFDAIVGKENALWEENVTSRYTGSMTPRSKKILGVIRPKDVSQVQEIVKAASKLQVAIYPISTGRNWGYGDTVPIVDNNIILDLSRMNNIVEISEELAYAVIEPGVTQGHLYQNLKSRGIPLRFDISGAGPLAGILGNCIERGFGISRLADHFLSICGMEIVLPSGELLRTGHWHYENCKTAHAYKWGVGPFIDGLFTQSNLGIVTKIGIWLEPIPEYFEACYIQCNSLDSAAQITEELAYLKRNNLLTGSFTLGHYTRMLATRKQYPFDAVSQKTPLPFEISKKMASDLGLAEWNGMIPLYGNKDHVKLMKKQIKQRLKKHASAIRFVSERKLKFLEKAEKLISLISKQDISAILNAVRQSFDALQGIPNHVTMATPYWRNRSASPKSKEIDPVADMCGMMWFAPIIPLNKFDIKTLVTLCTSILHRFNFDPCIGYLAVSDRALVVSIPILYNREDAADCNRALECYDLLLQECKKNGYVSYRLAANSMSECKDPNDSFWKFTRQIKECLDPNSIIAPGRYI